MTQEQKDRNIRLAKALESGKYKQITDNLRHAGGHCCLGVACSLVKNEMRLTWKDLQEDENCALPCSRVVAHYGWDNSNPNIEVSGVIKEASIHNDNGATFAQIAQGFRKLAEA